MSIVSYSIKLSKTLIVSSLALVSSGVLAVQDVDSSGYKVRSAGESEFDNQSESFIKDWRESDSDYEDTVFGDLMYNEPSTPTKLEMLRLLSKDTPSMMVFMHAVSMGVNIEDILQAAVKYEPNKGRDFATSAVSLLPLLTESTAYLYSSYGLEDLDRDDSEKPYLVADVVERFFENRKILRPHPDWIDGQYHFLASAAELSELQKPQNDVRWYKSKSTSGVERRPIFVSLYEANRSVLIDGHDRISATLAEDEDALLPVVFVFNRLNERSMDELGYSASIKGVQKAYSEKSLMLTPAPEWQLGEYHMYAELSEFKEVFNIPSKEDFEPEAWDRLVAEAEDYTVTNKAFLLVILGAGDEDVGAHIRQARDQQLFAAWDNPRDEGQYKYAAPSGADPVTLKNLLGDGLILNRPDLIAALDTLGVQSVPVAFYYLDSSRVKPYTKGPRGLIQAAIGAGTPRGSFGDGGGYTPPPPASPPGIQQ